MAEPIKIDSSDIVKVDIKASLLIFTDFIFWVSVIHQVVKSRWSLNVEIFKRF